MKFLWLSFLSLWLAGIGTGIVWFLPPVADASKLQRVNAELERTIEELDQLVPFASVVEGTVDAWVEYHDRDVTILTVEADILIRKPCENIQVTRRLHRVVEDTRSGKVLHTVEPHWVGTEVGSLNSKDIIAFGSSIRIESALEPGAYTMRSEAYCGNDPSPTRLETPVWYVSDYEDRPEP